MIYNMTSQAKFTVTDWMGPNINIITAHTIISTSLLHRKCLPNATQRGCRMRSLQWFALPILLLDDQLTPKTWQTTKATRYRGFIHAGEWRWSSWAPNCRHRDRDVTFDLKHPRSREKNHRAAAVCVCVCVCVCVWGGGFLTAAANNWRENLRMDAS